MTAEVMTMYLEKHEAARNQHRFYRLSVERNLFGEFSVLREWGRIGQSITTRLDLHERLEDAHTALASIARQKQRRGYRSL